jgi:hypothetical protein
MITIKTRVKGLKEFIAKNNSAIGALERGDFTEALKDKTVNRAKYRAPNKSGKLVKSIKGKTNSSYSFTITCDAVNEKGESYPEFLEFGTRYIAIGTPEAPRVIHSPYKGGSQKTAHLPFLRWSLWVTLNERNVIFKKTILKYYE